jgi:glycerol-3-phosphate acyltransferase PlsY
VARNAGKFAGVLTLLLDAGKGYLAVWIAGRWTGGDIRWMMAAAVAAVIGHVFPVWLRFKGGKGVATCLGVFLAVAPQAVVAAAVLWLLVVAFWRYSSLGSIAAVAALPALVYLFYAPRHAPPTYVSLCTVLISLLILAKHRTNMQRLIAGEEIPLKFRR